MPPTKLPSPKIDNFKLAQRILGEAGVNISDDIVNDFRGVVRHESGGRHYNAKGNVLLSPYNPNVKQYAMGISQILPSTAAEVNKKYGLQLDPGKEVDNLALGLAYFAQLDRPEVGNDSVARRLNYVAGGNSRALKTYLKTGEVPQNKLYSGQARGGATYQDYVQKTASSAPVTEGDQQGGQQTQVIPPPRIVSPLPEPNRAPIAPRSIFSKEKPAEQPVQTPGQALGPDTQTAAPGYKPIVPVQSGDANIIGLPQLPTITPRAGTKRQAAPGPVAAGQPSSQGAGQAAPPIGQPAPEAKVQQAPSQAPQVFLKPYQTQEGETVETIGSDFGIQPSDILANNPNLQSGAPIQPGTTINLPFLGQGAPRTQFSGRPATAPTPGAMPTPTPTPTPTPEVSAPSTTTAPIAVRPQRQTVPPNKKWQPVKDPETGEIIAYEDVELADRVPLGPSTPNVVGAPIYRGGKVVDYTGVGPRLREVEREMQDAFNYRKTQADAETFGGFVSGLFKTRAEREAMYKQSTRDPKLLDVDNPSEDPADYIFLPEWRQREVAQAIATLRSVGRNTEGGNRARTILGNAANANNELYNQAVKGIKDNYDNQFKFGADEAGDGIWNEEKQQYQSPLWEPNWTPSGRRIGDEMLSLAPTLLTPAEQGAAQQRGKEISSLRAGAQADLGNWASSVGGFFRYLKEMNVPFAKGIYEWGKKSQAEQTEVLQSNQQGATTMQQVGALVGGLPTMITRLALYTLIAKKAGGKALGGRGAGMLAFGIDLGSQAAGRGENAEQIRTEFRKGMAFDAVFGVAGAAGRTVLNGMKSRISPILPGLLAEKLSVGKLNELIYKSENPLVVLNRLAALVARGDFEPTSAFAKLFKASERVGTTQERNILSSLGKGTGGSRTRLAPEELKQTIFDGLRGGDQSVATQQEIYEILGSSLSREERRALTKELGGKAEKALYHAEDAILTLLGKGTEVGIIVPGSAAVEIASGRDYKDGLHTGVVNALMHLGMPAGMRILKPVVDVGAKGVRTVAEPVARAIEKTAGPTIDRVAERVQNTAQAIDRGIQNIAGKVLRIKRRKGDVDVTVGPDGTIRQHDQLDDSLVDFVFDAEGGAAKAGDRVTRTNPDGTIETGTLKTNKKGELYVQPDANKRRRIKYDDTWAPEFSDQQPPKDGGPPPPDGGAGGAGGAVATRAAREEGAKVSRTNPDGTVETGVIKRNKSGELYVQPDANKRRRVKLDDAWETEAVAPEPTTKTTTTAVKPQGKGATTETTTAAEVKEGNPLERYGVDAPDGTQKANPISKKALVTPPWNKFGEWALRKLRGGTETAKERGRKVQKALDEGIGEYNKLVKKYNKALEAGDTTTATNIAKELGDLRSFIKDRMDYLDALSKGEGAFKKYLESPERQARLDKEAAAAAEERRRTQEAEETQDKAAADRAAAARRGKPSGGQETAGPQPVRPTKPPKPGTKVYRRLKPDGPVVEGVMQRNGKVRWMEGGQKKFDPATEQVVDAPDKARSEKWNNRWFEKKADAEAYKPGRDTTEGEAEPTKPKEKPEEPKEKPEEPKPTPEEEPPTADGGKDNIPAPEEPPTGGGGEPTKSAKEQADALDPLVRAEIRHKLDLLARELEGGESAESLAKRLGLPVEVVEAVPKKGELGVFGQMGYALRELMEDASDDFGELLAKAVAPLVRFTKDRATAANAVLDAIASLMGKDRTSVMTREDWLSALKKVLPELQKTPEVGLKIIEALDYQQKYSQAFRELLGDGQFLKAIKNVLAEGKLKFEEFSAADQEAILAAAKRIGDKYGNRETKAGKLADLFTPEAIQRAIDDALSGTDRPLFEEADSPGAIRRLARRSVERPTEKQAEEVRRNRTTKTADGKTTTKSVDGSVTVGFGGNILQRLAGKAIDIYRSLFPRTLSPKEWRNLDNAFLAEVGPAFKRVTAEFKKTKNLFGAARRAKWRLEDGAIIGNAETVAILNQIAFKDAGDSLGFYKSQETSGHLEIKQLRRMAKEAELVGDKKAAAQFLKLAKDIETAINSSNFNDFVVAVEHPNHVRYSKAILKEELGHRADERIRQTLEATGRSIFAWGVDTKAFKAMPIFQKIRKTLREQGYERDDYTTIVEMVGKALTDDGHLLLGITKAEQRSILNTYAATLVKQGVRPVEVLTHFGDLSSKGLEVLEITANIYGKTADIQTRAQLRTIVDILQRVRAEASQRGQKVGIGDVYDGLSRLGRERAENVRKALDYGTEPIPRSVVRKVAGGYEVVRTYPSIGGRALEYVDSADGVMLRSPNNGEVRLTLDEVKAIENASPKDRPAVEDAIFLNGIKDRPQELTMKDAKGNKTKVTMHPNAPLEEPLGVQTDGRRFRARPTQPLTAPAPTPVSQKVWKGTKATAKLTLEPLRMTRAILSSLDLSNFRQAHDLLVGAPRRNRVFTQEAIRIRENNAAAFKTIDKLTTKIDELDTLLASRNQRDLDKIELLGGRDVLENRLDTLRQERTNTEGDIETYREEHFEKKRHDLVIAIVGANLNGLFGKLPFGLGEGKRYGYLAYRDAMKNHENFDLAVMSDLQMGAARPPRVGEEATNGWNTGTVIKERDPATGQMVELVQLKNGTKVTLDSSWELFGEPTGSTYEKFGSRFLDNAPIFESKFGKRTFMQAIRSGSVENLGGYLARKARAGITAPIRISARAFDTGLAWVRFKQFNAMLGELQADAALRGKQVTPEQVQGLAKLINQWTGFVRLGKHDAMVPKLNSVIFSTRLAASRLNMLNPVWASALPEGVKGHYYKAAAKQIGFAAFMLVGAALSGAKVVFDDPTDPGSMRIRLGKYSYDFSGGRAQYLTYGARMLELIYDEFQKDKISTMTPREREVLEKKGTAWARGTALTGRFLLKKSHPWVSMIYGIAADKNVMGEPVTNLQAIQQAYTPIFASTLSEHMDEGMQGYLSAALDFIGEGGVIKLPDIKELQRKKRIAMADKNLAPTPRAREKVEKAWDKVIDYVRREQVRARKQEAAWRRGEGFHIPSFWDLWSDIQNSIEVGDVSNESPEASGFTDLIYNKKDNNE